MIRTSILPSLLGSVAYNQNRAMKDVAFFELSSVYAKGHMEERLAIAASGFLQKSRWQKIEIKADFYSLKGMLEALLARLGFEGKRIQIKENTLDTKAFHPYQSACLYLGKELVGIFGTIHPQMAKRYGVSDEVVMAELNLEVLLHNKAAKVKFAATSKYPSVNQDLAFVVDEQLPVGAIVSCIEKHGKLGKEQVIEQIEVFDVYRGAHVEQGYQSIALSITFRSTTHTLSEQEISTLREAILSALENELHAQLRA